MSSEDWFRHTTWTPEDAADFEHRLARSRTHRSEYLRVQAVSLASTDDAGVAEAALELAERCLSENRDGLFLAQMHATAGRALGTLGRFDEAITAYRQAMEAARAQPSARGTEVLDFAWFVATQGIAKQFGEAASALQTVADDRDLLFPSVRYRYFGALALLSADSADHARASEYAASALAAHGQAPGPFERHPDFGIVTSFDKAIHARIVALAG